MADAWSILGGPSQQHQSEHWPPWRLVETHWVPDLELGPLSAFGMAAIVVLLLAIFMPGRLGSS
jgi:hypothetical protein